MKYLSIALLLVSVSASAGSVCSLNKTLLSVSYDKGKSVGLDYSQYPDEAQGALKACQEGEQKGGKKVSIPPMGFEIDPASIQTYVEPIKRMLPKELLILIPEMNATEDQVRGLNTIISVEYFNTARMSAPLMPKVQL